MLISQLYSNGHMKIMGSSYEVRGLTAASGRRDVPCSAGLLHTATCNYLCSVMG